MTTTGPVAYYGDPELKAAVLAEMAAHREAETLVQGVYWNDGRGCAVGCLTHDSAGGHSEYPVTWGIPEDLAYLEDVIFEHLPLDIARVWPERFLGAIEPGADLSGVYANWSAVLMLDPEQGNIARCVGFPEAEAAVRQVGQLWQDPAHDPWSWDHAEEASREAARAIEPESAAWSAAESAAWSAAWATSTGAADCPATWAAAAADALAQAGHWRWMADLLIRCVEAAPQPARAEA